MSKAKHVMVSESKSLCGRAVVQGTGTDCKNCARVSAANSKRAAATVPSGNGLVEAHGVQVEACTLDNGDTVYVGKCEHGWETGFHTTEGDAHDVAAGHGEVTRALYAPPVAVEVIPPALTDEVIAAHGMDAADIAEYNVQRSADIESAVMTAQKAITDNRRVFVAEAHNWGGTAAFDALVASGWAELIKDGDMSRYVSSRETPGGVRTVGSEGVAVPFRPWVDNTCPSGGQHEPSFRYPMSSHGGVTEGTCCCGIKVRVADIHSRDYVSETEIIAMDGNHCGNGYCAECPACVLARTRFLALSGDSLRAGVTAAIEASGTCAPADDHFDVDRIVMTIVAYYGHVDVNAVPTPEFWAIIQDNARPAAEPVALAVGNISKPMRTKLAKRARKALSRKHKPSKVHRG